MLGVDKKHYCNAVESGEWIVITTVPTGMYVIEKKDMNPIRRGEWPIVRKGDVEETLVEGMPYQLFRASLIFGYLVILMDWCSSSIWC